MAVREASGDPEMQRHRKEGRNVQAEKVRSSAAEKSDHGNDTGLLA